MTKSRKNRKDKSHLSEKRAERRYKRLIAAEVKKEERRHREELESNREGSPPSFSPSNSPISEHCEAHSFRSRSLSPTSHHSVSY